MDNISISIKIFKRIIIQFAILHSLDRNKFDIELDAYINKLKNYKGNIK